MVLFKAQPVKGWPLGGSPCLIFLEKDIVREREESQHIVDELEALLLRREEKLDELKALVKQKADALEKVFTNDDGELVAAKVEIIAKEFLEAAEFGGGRKMNETDLIYKAAWSKWGDLQWVMVIEECAELQKVVTKILRKKGNEVDLAEEMADVQIMLDQIRAVNEPVRISMDITKAKKIKKLRELLEAAKQ